MTSICKQRKPLQNNLAVTLVKSEYYYSGECGLGAVGGLGGVCGQIGGCGIGAGIGLEELGGFGEEGEKFTVPVGQYHLTPPLK